MTPKFHGKKRKTFLEKIQFEFDVNPVVAILGPRQCGKTTLAQQFIETLQFHKQNYFDLENDRDLERLKDPFLTLSQLEGLIVIDEIQRIPELFPKLRVLVDDRSLKQRYLILGSASKELLRQASETLAGRISYLELTPFTYPEVEDIDLLFLRGGYPRSYLARKEIESYAWRQAFIKTYLEKDIPSFGITLPSERLRRFWQMLSHYHGSIFNASEIGKSLEMNHKMVHHYLDILSQTFMVRQLKPWYENISKRQVKSSKIYFRDTGILHTLLGIENREGLLLHPKLGSSWEGFALEEIIRYYRAEPEECFFWATQQEAELDLLITKEGKKRGFAFKYGSAPKVTKSMQIAMKDLHLEELTIIYPGEIDYPLQPNIHVKGLMNFR